MTRDTIMDPCPAGTVVLVRERRAGLQVLLLQRNSTLVFEGGAWVFPGGRVDPGDYPRDGGGDEDALAARNAAVREAREEAGVSVPPGELIHIAHWTTPEGPPRRFATWFFLCPLHGDPPVVVDRSEILDFCWLSPAKALRRHRDGRIRLPRPTLATLKDLLPYRRLAELCEDKRCSDVLVFPPDSPYYRNTGGGPAVKGS